MTTNDDAPTSEATAPHPYRDVSPTRPRGDGGSLLAVDVSGVAGVDSVHGHNGEMGRHWGEDGQHGGDASPAHAGQAAGEIRLTLTDGGDGLVTVRGSSSPPSRPHQAIDDTFYVGDAGSIVLRAIGGRGGRGGDGGNGGAGAGGKPGADATRYSDGSNGGPGGCGGDGGDGSSGGPGGRGGTVRIMVDAADTVLLMLVEPSVSGGSGGAAGSNGYGGEGGAGGSGGSSYSWSETDSDGDSTSHSNSGGWAGRDGDSGRSGGANIAVGADGEDGTFSIEVAGDSAGSPATYRARYDLQLCHFVHLDASSDGIYEPGEKIILRAIQVENTGAMPTPPAGSIEVRLDPTSWHTPFGDGLRLPGGLAEQGLVTLDGELRTRLADRRGAVGEPLKEQLTLLPEAWVPAVRRQFVDFAAEASSFGAFVLQWPVQLAEPAYLRALAAGETTRVRINVTNLASRPLGRSPSGRAILVRVRSSSTSDLGDAEVTLRVDGVEMSPSSGWLYEVEKLAAHAMTTLELEVTIRADAPSYRQWHGEVVLELGHVAAPHAIQTIQVRPLQIRVARRFVPDDADLLLVVNHRTTAAALAAWEELAHSVMARVAVWDLSREQHLDLAHCLPSGKSLSAHFEGKAIAILDNEFVGPDGPVRAHEYLCPEQLRHAAESGLEIALLGGPLDLRARLFPAATPADSLALVTTADEAAVALRRSRGTSMVVEHTSWWPWWRPTDEWLAHRARLVSDHLQRALPAERHVVIHRFEPALRKKQWIGGRWRVGTIETRRTLDAAAASVVHAEVGEAIAFDPSVVRAGAARLAVLAMLDVEQQLERLRWVLADDPPAPSVVTEILAALLAGLTGELALTMTPGSTLPRDLDQVLPRLAAVAARSGTASRESPAGVALIDFAASLWHVARCQVRWFERLPPWRWRSRSQRLRNHVRHQLARWSANVFGDAAVEDVWKQIERHADELLGAMRPKTFWWASRRQRGLAHGRRILDTPGLTADTELLAEAADRVIDAATADALAVAADAATARRSELMRLGAIDRATLAVASISPGDAT